MPQFLPDIAYQIINDFDTDWDCMERIAAIGSDLRVNHIGKAQQQRRVA